MTLNEHDLGAALGAEWEHDIPANLWYLTIDDAAVEVGKGATQWWVVRKHGVCSSTDGWPCDTPEQAVAVAHLLVAAERIADGAAVKPDKTYTWIPVSAKDGLVVLNGLPGEPVLGPARARSIALHLLRAADEAEAP